MTDRVISERPKKTQEPTVPRNQQNDQTAEQHLGDVQFLLYSARAAARYFWALACRKYPELKEWQ